MKAIGCEERQHILLGYRSSKNFDGSMYERENQGLSNKSDYEIIYMLYMLIKTILNS